MNQICVDCKVDVSTIAFRLEEIVEGKNPLNVNLSVDNPDMVSAKMGAVGPGIAETVILFSWHASTSLNQDQKLMACQHRSLKQQIFLFEVPIKERALLMPHYGHGMKQIFLSLLYLIVSAISLLSECLRRLLCPHFLNSL